MFEKLFAAMPEWMKGQLVIRVIYTISSFITARAVAFLTGSYLASVLALIMKHLATVGIQLEVKVVAIDQGMLQAAVTGFLMIAAEYIIHQVHSKIVLPNVTQKPAAAPTPIALPPQ